MSVNSSNSKGDNTKDLDDLLDSALGDFDTANSAKSTDKDIDTAEANCSAETWNEEFIGQQAKLFEEQMANVFAGVDGAPSGDQMNLTFQKMAEAAALAVQGVDENAQNSTEPQLAQSLTIVLKSLKEGSGLLQESIPPEGLSGMFAGLGLDDASGDNPFLPMMQGMMQSLLSAEVLLPSLKELLEKYPSHLDENKDKISSTDMDRYQKQQELFKVICAELEKESPNDSADVKNERFKIVLKNMQKLNEYGQPPNELLADPNAASNIPAFDPSALNDPSQCCLM